MAKYVIRKQTQGGSWPRHYEVDDVSELPEEVANAVRLLDAVSTDSFALIPGVGQSTVGNRVKLLNKPFYRNYYLCMFKHPGRRTV